MRQTSSREYYDLGFFAWTGDMDGLYKALEFAFSQSARVRGPNKVQLREILTARGAGFTCELCHEMCTSRRGVLTFRTNFCWQRPWRCRKCWLTSNNVDSNHKSQVLDHKCRSTEHRPNDKCKITPQNKHKSLTTSIESFYRTQNLNHKSRFFSDRNPLSLSVLISFFL